MEIQAILKKLNNDIEEKNRLIASAEAKHCHICKAKYEMELEVAIENYSSVFSALPMLM